MNLPTIQTSCTSAGLATTDNSPQDTDALEKAIQIASSSADVDARFILAVVVSPAFVSTRSYRLLTCAKDAGIERLRACSDDDLPRRRGTEPGNHAKSQYVYAF